MKRLISTFCALLSLVCASAFKTDTVTVATKHLAAPMKVVVITPDGAADTRFPSVYMLNGHGGDYRQWSCQTAPGILGPLADAYGMILVMPDGRDSWYWDAPDNPGMQMETFFVEDLVPDIDKNFPTIGRPGKRAITGLSMGGHGALYLAARHPGIFHSVGSMSGNADICAFPDRWNVPEILGKYEENKAVWQKHSVMSLLPKMKTAKLNIIFDCGVDDFFARVNEKLHMQMKRLGIPHEYTTRPGRHSHKYWANSIKHHLLFFDAVFKDIDTK